MKKVPETTLSEGVNTVKNQMYMLKYSIHSKHGKMGEKTKRKLTSAILATDDALSIFIHGNLDVLTFENAAPK